MPLYILIAYMSITGVALIVATTMVEAQTNAEDATEHTHPNALNVRRMPNAVHTEAVNANTSGMAIIA